MTDGRLLARNTLLNLLGQVFPLLVALVALPLLIAGLGAERFAILALTWTAIGYFGAFEFGLSRALTQAVAQRLGAGTGDELAAVAWPALLLQLCLGMVGAILLAAATPLVVTHLLNVPPELRQETTQAFYILSASLPIVFMSAGLRGVLEAHQHFGAVTALRVPLVFFMFVGPLIVLPFSRSLLPAVISLVIGRILVWVAYLVICVRRFEFLRQGVVIQPVVLMPLLRFGGWTTVTNVVSPLMEFMDRFLIGVLLPIAAVTHYVTPYEAIVKVLVVPSAMLGVLFPAFAATYMNDRDRMGRLYDRALRMVMYVMFPISLVAIAFAHEALGIWMGNALPVESGVVLKWLAAGVFINAIAQAPYSALQGTGRPDLIARLHVSELPIYAVAIFLLVRAFGLPGVAMAWVLRVSIDAIALLVISRRALGVALLPSRGAGWILTVMLASLPLVTLLPPGAKMVAVPAALLLYVPLGWMALLSRGEREAILDLRHRGDGGDRPMKIRPEGAA